MGLNTKYQYTYFIHPFMIREKNMQNYLQSLLNDENCKLRIFDKAKDIDIYSYFLPVIRNYVFWSFNLEKKEAQDLEKLGNDTLSAILMKYPCSIFEYETPKDIQAKIEEDGIFFSIQKMEIICFQTGVCFLSMKTVLEDETKFSDILNFNYKFRDINSSVSKYRGHEKIKIQSDTYQDMEGFTSLIDRLTNYSKEAEKLNVDMERFITYSYSCVDQQSWNTQTDEELVKALFYKYKNVLPASRIVSFENNEHAVKNILDGNFIKYGFSNTASCLLTTNSKTENFTKLPLAYENQYLYTYIIELYKKLYMNKIELEIKEKRNSDKTRLNFVKFTNEIWAKEITNDNIGTLLFKQWEEILEIKSLYETVKDKFNILLKERHILKGGWVGKITIGLLALASILGILNLIFFL